MRFLFLILMLWSTSVYSVPSYVSLRPLLTYYWPSSTNNPGGQDAAAAFDGDINSKYLNFDKFNTGVAVKLSQGKVVSGLELTTGGDFAGRDPASFKISGSNDGVTWTLIDSQSITLSNNRGAMSSFIIANTNAYVYYNLVFPTVKNPDTTCGFDCNSMQIAEITFIYDENDPTTSVDTGTVAWLPFPSVYCCGGSGSAFNANPGNVSKVMLFRTRTTADSQVYIDQLGNANTITIEQKGNKDNYVNYSSNGSFNTTTINQTSTTSSQTNFIDLAVNGNSNLINIDQNSYNAISNFGKGAFINIADDINSLTIQQKDGGSHYASVILSGGSKHVDILQQGAANHMTDINLSGQPVDLSLQQSGATQQYYSINFNCATVGGCAPIQVQQGQ